VGSTCAAQKDFSRSVIDRGCFKRIYHVSAYFFRTDELLVVIRQKGFRVKALAVHVGLDVRTLERRFREQFRTTPKAWIIRERMSFAPPLLAEGLSNKQVAASLSYTCESNFCRDFKRSFGCAPQEFVCASKHNLVTSRFDKKLSRFDKGAELRRQIVSKIL
jgi:AraC-like DNA-binding protein